jgi:hypothetical protein
MTVDYLTKAREAGFTDWQRIMQAKEFEKVRDDPRIKKFLDQEDCLPAGL